MVQQIMLNYMDIKEMAALFGPDLSRWPARMVDALVVVEHEAAREESARAEALEQKHGIC